LGIILFCSILTAIYFKININWVLDDGFINATIIKTYNLFNKISHHPSEIVITTTSPIYLLMGIIISKMGFNDLVSLQIVGIIFLNLLGIYIYIISKKDFSIMGAGIIMMMIIFSPPLISYSQSGLETIFYGFVSFIILHNIIENKHRYSIWLLVLLILIRPDGILLLPFYIYFIVSDKSFLFQKIFKTCILGLIVLLTYNLLLFNYYDTIIPQSIIAKNAMHDRSISSTLWNIKKYLLRIFVEKYYMYPFYVLSIYGGIYLVKKDIKYKIYAYYIMYYYIIYMMVVPLYSWYTIPPLVVIIYLSGIGCWLTINKLQKWLNKKILIIGFIVILGEMNNKYFNYRKEQSLYNINVLMGVGTWLNQYSIETETIFTETLGYIGYYSERKIIDIPGLRDIRVPKLIKTKKGMEKFNICIQKLTPNYLALRSYEWKHLNSQIKENYSILKIFYAPNNHGPDYIIAKVISEKG